MVSGKHMEHKTDYLCLVFTGHQGLLQFLQQHDFLTPTKIYRADQ
jgi:hypothetical protein